MVQVNFISAENGILRYSYRPEKDGLPGILAYNTATEEPVIELLAENDVESTFYRNHVFNMMKDNVSEQPKEQTIVWY